jgi:hypothetical protein
MSQKATTDELNAINGLLEGMPADFFSGEASDTQTGTDITIGEAIGLTDLKMFGDTEQASYTGKNLVDYLDSSLYLTNSASATVGANNVAITKTVANQYAYAIYKLTTDQTNSLLGKTINISYDKSLTISNVDSGVYVYWIASGTSISLGQQIARGVTTTTGFQSFSFDVPSTIPDDTKPQIALLFYPDRTNTNIADSATMTVSNLQLEVGSTASPYEPFTGGQPSPSPDYPQNINVVTGEQTVKVTGKNLFDTTNYTIIGSGLTIARNTDGSFTVNGTNSNNILISFQNNINLDGDYTLATIGEKTPTNTSYFNLYSNDDLTGNITSYNLGSINHYKNFSSSIVTKSQRILLAAGTYNNFIIKPILVKGTYDLSNIGDYEPYQGQSYTVDLGSTELCKIGDYQDYIYKSGGDWYVHKEVGKLTLAGTVDESWGVGNSTGSPDCVYCASTILDSLSLSTGGVQTWAKCSHFTNAGKGLVSGIRDNISEFAIGTSTSRLRLLVRKEIATNKATWETWLSTNTPVVYYTIDTPTDTKITDSTLIGELEAVLGMTCYEETNVVVTSTNLAGALELVAVNKTLGGIISMLRGRS